MERRASHDEAVLSMRDLTQPGQGSSPGAGGEHVTQALPLPVLEVMQVHLTLPPPEAPSAAQGTATTVSHKSGRAPRGTGGRVGWP